MNELEKRILFLSHKYQLSHIGSCLITVNVLDKIYSIRKSDEPVVLGNGHAGLALYVVLEKYGYGNAEELWKKHGTHPNRDIEHGIYVSSGSLGHGIGIAVGMAIADKNRLIYLLMSDGECAEGSVWEALRIAGELRLENLRVSVIANGYSANGRIDVEELDSRIVRFYPSLVVKSNLFQLPDYLNGLSGHYHILTEVEYQTLVR
jgi:transketolase